MKKWTPLIILPVGMALICGLFVYNNKDRLIRKYRWHFEEDVNKPLEKFSQKCLQKLPGDTATQKAINLRHCVNINSAFSVDKEKHAPIWQDRAAMMFWLNNYVEKTTSTPPPMECFYRARTLNRSLKILGYLSHTIVITRDSDNFFDHVIIETLNPDSKKWEIHDPTYDVKFFSKKDRQALGLKEIMIYNFDDFEPCDYEGKCGWDLVSRENFDVKLVKDYLSSAYIPQEETLYTSRNFDENKQRNVYGENMSFCEWKPEYCKRIVRLEN